MRVVADTNTLISALITRNGPPSVLMNYWMYGFFHLLFSSATFDELIRVLNYPHIRNRLDYSDINAGNFLSHIRSKSIWVEPDFSLDIVQSDSTDNRIVELAEAGNAKFIVTEDKHLLALGSYKNIKIVSPAIFISLPFLQKSM
jgi:putative PIN family toxin of toxin-antitoxin system